MSAFLLLFLLTASSIEARVRPAGFVIPARMLPLGNAVTPGEYAQVKAAIAAWEQEHAQMLREGAGIGDLSRIEATRVKLGSLEGVIVSFDRAPACGATGNCPMALLVRGANGYRLAVMSGGWGYALLPSGGAVPDIAFYWNMSVGESDAQLFHFAHGRFTTESRTRCIGTNSGNPICAAMGTALQNTHRMAVSPAEYDVLRPAVGPGLQGQSPGSAPGFSFNDTHAINILDMWLVSATVVTTGACGSNRNCNISIYARHHGDRTYWPLLRNVSGWGVAEGTLIGAPFTQVAFVIARHMSAKQDLLTRYVVPLATNHLGDLTHSSRLFPDACELVTPKSGHWPAQWNAAALVAQPVPCFKPTSPEQPQTPAVDITNIISAVAQGAAGTVWAAGGGRSRQLYRWHDGGWKDVPSPMPVSATSPLQPEYLMPQSVGVWPDPTNGVLVLWLDPETQKSELFWQRGDQAKLLAAAPAVYQGAHLDIETVASAASGIVAITGDQRGWRNGVPVSGQAAGIYQLSDKGQLERIYTFTLDQYLPYRVQVMGLPMFMPLSTTRDAQGKIWIWCGWSWRRMPQDAALEGLFVTDGKTVQYHRRIPGLPNAHLVTLDVWDGHHLAAGTFGGGLYTIDTATFEAHPVAEPEPGAFRFVKRVFRAGNDRYVLTFEPHVRGGIAPGRPGAVWRLRNGQWKQVLKDAADVSGVGLATADGLWLGTSDFRGLWFIPVDGPARRVTTQQGLPLNDVKHLFQLPDGDILATGGPGHFPQTRSAEFNPEALLSQTVTSTRFTVIYPHMPLQPDRERNLWGLIKPGVLSEWNGARWVSHPLPPEIQFSHFTGLDLDTRGRVWLFPNCRFEPIGFFDPAQNHWNTYSDYRPELAQQSRPIKFLHPARDWPRPIYGPAGQIVFLGPCGGVNYYDGADWHLWNRPQLPGQLNLVRPPFFDASGHVAVDPEPHAVPSANQVRPPGWDTPKTWEWTPDLRWHIVPYQPGKLVPHPNLFAAAPSPPAGCVTMSPSSLVHDSTGRAWWVADGALYMGTPGQCRRVLPDSAAQPFIDGRQLDRALLDAHGNVFLETQLPFSYVILRRSTYAKPTPASAAEMK